MCWFVFGLINISWAVCKPVFAVCVSVILRERLLFKVPEFERDDNSFGCERLYTGDLMGCGIHTV